MLSPKNGAFQIKVDHIKNAVDVEKIKKYLLNSYNQFRSDYGLAPVTEDVKMSEDANAYSINPLAKQLVHEKGNFNECLVYLPFTLLSHLDPNKVDINKVIADCYFDSFVGSPGHMSNLLNPNVSVAGFGITKDNGGFVICIRNH
jgi:uncharacterized protein YkwD